MARFLRGRQNLSTQGTYRGPIRASMRIAGDGQLYFVGWKFRMSTQTIFATMSMLRSPASDLFSKLDGAFEDDEFCASLMVLQLKEWQDERLPITGEIAEQLYLVDAAQGVNGLETTAHGELVAVATHVESKEDGVPYVFERAAERVPPARICGPVGVKLGVEGMVAEHAAARRLGVIQ
jgi:hypothetical protein